MSTTSNEANRFGERLVYLRQMARLSQRRLAQLSGVSHHTIAALEQARQDNPGLRTLARLARALEVKVEDLIEGINESWWTN